MEISTGLHTSLTYLSTGNNFKGLAVTAGYLNSKIFSGVAIAGYNNTTQMNGLSFALFNRTKELHGVQLGLLNFAANNPKWMKLIPLINFHF